MLECYSRNSDQFGARNLERLARTVGFAPAQCVRVLMHSVPTVMTQTESSPTSDKVAASKPPTDPQIVLDNEIKYENRASLAKLAEAS